MLKQGNCIKSALNTAGLTLEANTGESFLVKAIYVGIVTTASYLAVKVDNFSVAYYLVFGKRGNELGGVRHSCHATNLMKLLVDRDLPFSIPVAEGQKLTLPVLDGAGTMQVVYDRYDAGDIRADMPNGTASKQFGFLQYLRETTVITASGDLLLDKAITPAEFPDFPCGKAVPANMRIKLHGITGCPVADYTSGSNGFHSTYLKLVKDREVLFDEDRLGFPFLGDTTETSSVVYDKSESIIGSVGEFTAPFNYNFVKPPLFFDPPLEFMSGEELLVYLTFVKVGTHTMTANIAAVALILEVNKS